MLVNNNKKGITLFSVVQKDISFLCVSTGRSVWLCKVVKLSMQCCGQTLKDSFETYKTFPR